MRRPFFFGEDPHRLFGVYHPPTVESSGAPRAVVLCPPAPQEYMTTHWAYRRLAALLAKGGTHVLRFDYFGTGDSAGETTEGTLDIWQNDVLLAEKALREQSGAERVSLVGYRMGAVLAWRATRSTEPRPRDLVLWDPVIAGSAYLRELQATDNAFASRLLYFPKFETPPRELGGYALPSAQRLATEAVDLMTEPLPTATRVHCYVGRETPESLAMSERLKRELKRFSYQHVPEEGFKGSGNLLSNRILQVIGAALSSEGA
jgi:pimeloyl-ACP methyl ester carboxylesterase